MPPLPAPRRAFLREPRHVVACLRLLVFAGLAVLGWSAPPAEAFLFWTVTVVYGVSVLGYMVAGNGEFGLRRVRFAIFLFDVAVVAGLIVLRGRDVQALVMAYFTLVLLAALLAGVGSALLNGLVVSALFVAVTGWGEPPAALLSLDRLSTMLFFFVIAVFMGHVAGDARGRRAAARRRAPAVALRESTARLRALRDGAQATERLHTLGLLAAGIAHEMRRPLAAVLAGCRDGPALLCDLQERAAAGEDATDLVQELGDVFQDCGHAAGRLQSLAEDLNAVSGGSREVRAVPPCEALAGAARLLQSSAGERVRIEVASESERRVHMDAARLQQVLLILGDNALAAMADGGVLRLCAEDRGEDRVAFSVEDSGCGIEESVQARMYDPFFTTKAPGRGTGLGLFVLREIVQAHAGSVVCRSAPGRGARFCVELPALPGAATCEAA